MLIDKRKLMNLSKSQTCFFAMYLSSQTLLLVFILISISWNAYNTYQYRFLVERQSQLERRVTECLSDVSSMEIRQSQSTKNDQWFSKISHLTQRLTENKADSVSNSNELTVIGIGV